MLIFNVRLECVIFILCSLGCPKGLYGKHCNKKCNCANNGRCHRTYGACLCDPGLYGRFCHLCKSSSISDQQCLETPGDTRTVWFTQEGLVPGSTSFSGLSQHSYEAIKALILFQTITINQREKVQRGPDVKRKHFYFASSLIFFH